MKILFHKPEDKYGELSNFFVLDPPLVVDGLTFTTSEHLYQYRKFSYEGASKASLEYAELIRTTNTAYKSKILAGQRVSNKWAWMRPLNESIEKYKALGVTLRPDWENVKLSIMKEVLVMKFNHNERAREILLATNDAELVEHTSTDKFWADGGDGTGLNHLGRLLEEVREETTYALICKRLGCRISTADFSSGSCGFMSGMFGDYGEN